MATKLNPDSPLAKLMEAPARPGHIVWIGLRPARRAAMIAVERAKLTVADGLVGDRYASRTTRSRQLTLIGAEDLAAIASYLGLDEALPEQLRRNVVVSGINLLALKDSRIRLGSALLEITGECHPCSKMEETFGPGGYNAVRGHGGLTARVIEGGEIILGDALVRLDDVPG